MLYSINIKQVSWLIKLLTSSISLLIFSLLLSVAERGVFKYPTMNFFFSPVYDVFWSSIIRCIYILSSWWIDFCIVKCSYTPPIFFPFSFHHSTLNQTLTFSLKLWDNSLLLSLIFILKILSTAAWMNPKDVHIIFLLTKLVNTTIYHWECFHFNTLLFYYKESKFLII